MSLREEIARVVYDTFVDSFYQDESPYAIELSNKAADAIMGLKIRVDNEVMDWLYNSEPTYKTIAELEGK